MSMRVVAAFLASALSLSLTAAPLVYQGQLLDAGRPADGRYDLRLTPHAQAAGGAALAGGVVFEDVEVRAGQFRLEADFGAAIPAGSEPWLEVAVRDGASSGDFNVIGTREQASLAPLIGQCWSTTGDTGAVAGTNFLGNVDAQPLELRVLNARVARFDSASIQIGAASTPAQSIGVGTATPTQKLDIAGNLRVSGAIMPNGVAGAAGQVLTSSGAGVAPTWEAATFGGGRFSLRYDNTTAQTAGTQTDNNFSTAVNAPASQTSLLSFFALDYNSNSDVSIDITNHTLTFNRAGLYHLQGMLRYFLNSSQAQPADVSASLALKINSSANNFLLDERRFGAPGSLAGNNIYNVAIPFEVERQFAAGTTLEFEVKMFNLDTNPGLVAIGISRGGFISGHFISD